MSFKERATVQQAARAARDERATVKMYMTETEAKLRETNHAECSRAGIKNAGEIRSRGDALVAQMALVIQETNLSAREVVELRHAMAQAPVDSTTAQARRDQFIADTRKGSLRSVGDVAAQMDRVKAGAHQSPALKKALLTGNAGNSLSLARSLYRRSEDGQPILRNPKSPR